MGGRESCVEVVPLVVVFRSVVSVLVALKKPS